MREALRWRGALGFVEDWNVEGFITRELGSWVNLMREREKAVDKVAVFGSTAVDTEKTKNPPDFPPLGTRVDVLFPSYNGARPRWFPGVSLQVGCVAFDDGDYRQDVGDGDWRLSKSRKGLGEEAKKWVEVAKGGEWHEKHDHSQIKDEHDNDVAVVMEEEDNDDQEKDVGENSLNSSSSSVFMDIPPTIQPTENKACVIPPLISVKVEEELDQGQGQGQGQEQMINREQDQQQEQSDQQQEPKLGEKLPSCGNMRAPPLALNLSKCSGRVPPEMAFGDSCPLRYFKAATLKQLFLFSLRLRAMMMGRSGGGGGSSSSSSSSGGKEEEEKVLEILEGGLKFIGGFGGDINDGADFNDGTDNVHSSREAGGGENILLRMLADFAYQDFSFDDGSLHSAELVGSGAFGEVRVIDHPLRGKAAVKVIPRKCREGTAVVVARVFDEINTMERCRGEGCMGAIQLLGEGGGRKGDFFWIKMELAEGGDLLGWRKNFTLNSNLPLPPSSLFLQIFGAVCNAVSEIHARGVVHHDVKCSNVMVRRIDIAAGDVDVCIGDFGEAEIAQAEHLIAPAGEEGGQKQSGLGTFHSDAFHSDAIHAIQADTIRTGTVRARGTERIQSPEMLAIVDRTRVDGNNFDRRRGGVDGKLNVPDASSDVWSLGCLLYEVIVGDFMFDTGDWARFFMLLSHEKMGTLPEKDKIEIMREVLARGEEEEEDGNGEEQLFEEMEKIMKSCLARERERRLSAAEIGIWAANAAENAKKHVIVE